MRYLAKAIARISGDGVREDWDENSGRGIVLIDRREDHILTYS